MAHKSRTIGIWYSQQFQVNRDSHKIHRNTARRTHANNTLQHLAREWNNNNNNTGKKEQQQKKTAESQLGCKSFLISCRTGMVIRLRPWVSD